MLILTKGGKLEDPGKIPGGNDMEQHVRSVAQLVEYRDYPAGGDGFTSLREQQSKSLIN